MFDKFTMYTDRADFSRVSSPIELNNKEWLIKHPLQYFPKVSYCSGSYFGNSFKIEVSIPKIIISLKPKRVILRLFWTN